MLTQKQISIIRSFNRNYTTTLGLLNRDVFDTSLSFPESRVLLQINETGNITPKEISTKLDLDASYTSRLLKKLNKLGYINLNISPSDARSKIVELSKAGQQIVQHLDDDSNVQIKDLIQDLSPQQQEQLYEAFNTINTILFEKETN